MEKFTNRIKKNSWLKRVINNTLQIRELTMFLIIIIFGLLIYSINRDFITVPNLVNILRGSAFYFIIGCGVTYVIIAGELDLSVGSAMALSGLISVLILKSGLNIPIILVVILAVIVGILSGAAIGFISGNLVTRLKIPSLVVTLGFLYALRGVVLIITKGKTIVNLPASFIAIGNTEASNISFLIFYAIIYGVILHLILNYTKFGYHLKGVGGNKIAAKAAGINVSMVKISAFMIAGLSAALGGVIMASRISAASPSIGSGYELYVISAVIIGGTSLFGGSGSILGTFLGALFLSILNNGVQILNINPSAGTFITGIVMITAVGIDQYRRSRMWQISR